MMQDNDTYESDDALCSSTDNEEDVRILQPNSETTVVKLPSLLPYSSRDLQRHSHRILNFSAKDLKQFEDGTWYNDLVMDFGLSQCLRRYELSESSLNSVWIWSTFFYTQLTDKGVHAVERWSRKWDVFTPDVLVIPVNHSYHWTLVIICQPGSCLQLPETDLLSAPRTQIVSMDSLGGSQQQARQKVEEWLFHEAQPSLKGKQWHSPNSWPLDAPQQPNYFDCGPYSIYNLTHFLMNYPRVLDKISMKSPQWRHIWRPQLAGHMRAHLRQQMKMKSSSLDSNSVLYKLLLTMSDVNQVEFTHSPLPYLYPRGPTSPGIRAVFSTAELLFEILASNGFPRASKALLSPHQVPLSIAITGPWLVTACFIHPEEVETYHSWISVGSKLCCVSQLFRDNITPYLVRDLWIDHPFRLKKFLDGYATGHPNHRRAVFSSVRHLRVTWPMLVWNDWTNWGHDEHQGLRSYHDWPQAVYAIPLGYSLAAPIFPNRLWDEAMNLYRDMVHSFRHLACFDGGFTGTGTLVFMPTPPNALKGLAETSSHLNSLRLNTHAGHRELFNVLPMLPQLESLTLEVFLGEPESLPRGVTTLTLGNLTTLVIIFQCPDTEFLRAIEGWTIPFLSSLAIRFQGTATGDLVPVLTVLRCAATRLRLTTLSLDWSHQPPQLLRHFTLTDIVLHHSSGPVTPYPKDSETRFYCDPERQWPFEHFLQEIWLEKYPKWPELHHIIDTTLYHSRNLEQRESLGPWARYWAPRLEDDCGVVSLDGYRRRIRDIVITVTHRDDAQMLLNYLKPGWFTGWVNNDKPSQMIVV
ncbi:hypothetical protein M422DRAFT_268382 [Sphaerobolus stellatus SS14]|uniref:Ubiquitin-like protease family profile domain-containing protein n=1 Tax=Sphaerobolus stellatus (strain SS14) TaxID=990650 RepID=A0A0C9UXM7_SPHS4|nr:hypothetical protein M422DRAFT_268382 [Sphaerobolus stellatus SS14]